jgi:hypothetical protein
MAANWSPTDLNRQRLVVRGIALRALEDRRRLSNARRELAAKLHAAVRSPAMLVGCFAAGWVVALAMGRRPKPKSKSTERRASGQGWRERVGAISASTLWLIQQYRQGQRLAERFSKLLAPKPQYEPADSAAESPQPPFAT